MPDRPALLGGEPVLDRPLHLVRPSLPPLPELIKGLEGLYASRMLTNQGANAAALEERIASELDVAHCAVFCNGTTALSCAVKALGVEGEVLVPSFTFAATVQALSWVGLTPRFVDVDPGTLAMDPALAEAAITNATSALVPVNLFGRCGPLDDYERLAAKRGISLVFDSAQSFGTRFDGRPLGSFGDAEVLSFHATKVLHAGEGGAVVTNDAALHERLCRMRNFGFGAYLDCVDEGTNGKLDELSALVALLLLERLPEELARRADVVARCRAALAELPGVDPPSVDARVAPNHAALDVSIDAARFGLTSLELNYALTAENVVSRCYFYPPVHRTAHYRARPEGRDAALPETDAAALRVLCLPLHAEMTQAEIDAMATALGRCQRYAGAVRRALEGRIPRGWDEPAASYSDPYERFVSGRPDSREPRG